MPPTFMIVIEHLDASLPQLAASGELRGRDTSGLESLSDEVHCLARHRSSGQVHLTDGKAALLGKAKNDRNLAERETVKDHGGAGPLTVEETANPALRDRIRKQLVVDPWGGGRQHLLHLVHLALTTIQ